MTKLTVADNKGDKMKNFFVRAVTSVFIVAVIVGAFVLRQMVDEKWMYLLFFVFAALGSFEMVNALKDRLTNFSKCLVIAYSLAIVPLYMFFGMSALLIMTVGAGILLLIAMVFDFEETTIEKTACGFFAMFYPSVLLIPLLLTNSLENNAFIALLLIFSISPIADAMAYIVGSLLKGPKLCTKINQKKTVSGAIGGLLGGVIISLLVWLLYAKGKVIDNATWELVLFIVTGLVGALFTELGDLVESAIKRKLEIKDMGHILPGHGGMLDRIDGNMLCSAFIYAVFAFIG